MDYLYGKWIGMVMEMANTKKQPNWISVWTSLLNLLLSVWIFFVPYIGIKNMSKLEYSTQISIVFQTAFPAAIAGFVFFWATIVAITIRRVPTPESLEADTKKNRKSVVVSSVVVLWAIYATVLVATAVEI